MEEFKKYIEQHVEKITFLFKNDDVMSCLISKSTKKERETIFYFLNCVSTFCDEVGEAFLNNNNERLFNGDGTIDINETDVFEIFGPSKTLYLFGEFGKLCELCDVVMGIYIMHGVNGKEEKDEWKN